MPLRPLFCGGAPALPGEIYPCRCKRYARFNWRGRRLGLGGEGSCQITGWIYVIVKDLLPAVARRSRGQYRAPVPRFRIRVKESTYAEKGLGERAGRLLPKIAVEMRRSDHGARIFFRKSGIFLGCPHAREGSGTGQENQRKPDNVPGIHHGLPFGSVLLDTKQYQKFNEAKLFQNVMLKNPPPEQPASFCIWLLGIDPVYFFEG